MANNIQEEILLKLERIKNNSRRSRYMTPDDYKQFMPETMGFKKDDESLRYKALDQIKEQGVDASYLTAIEAANKRARQAAIAMRKEKKQAKKQLKRAEKAYRPPRPNVSYIGGGGGRPGEGSTKQYPIGQANTGVPKGSTALPPGAKVGVGQHLTTVRAGGLSFTVNKYVAPRFVGLINDLVKQGYKPVSVGGYANRNQASGSGLKSLHAYGLAIDIDPAKNPYIQNPQGGRHALPANIGALAAKHGLVWGGNWKNTKDYMHFSVPYGGRW